MGFVSVSTLLIVQNSLPPSDLGVATSSQQFARTLGGTLGIGVSGSLATAMLIERLSAMNPLATLELAAGPSSDKFIKNVESLFQPEVLALLPLNVRESFQGAVLDGMIPVFAAVSAASVVSLLFCYFLPRDPGRTRASSNR
jgi:hypothetical protein